MIPTNVQGQAPLQSLPQTNGPNQGPASQITQAAKSTIPHIPPNKPLPEPPKLPNLQQAKPATGMQAENQRSESIQEKGSTTSLKTEGTIITKEISSGQHPHLDEETNKSVQDYFNTKKTDNTENVKALISNLESMGIIDADGNIDFGKLNPKSKENDSRFVGGWKELHFSHIAAKAGIKGKIFINEEGQFDFEIKGKCSEEAQKCMQALKDKLVAIKNKSTPPLDVNININPVAVGPLSINDQHILANGGQIQYRLLPNGETMKLTLNPSKNNGEGALRIDVYAKGAVNPKSTSGNIPLNVVFEGQELKGKKVGPFLENWRGQQLFEKSVIKENLTNFTPGIHLFDRFDGSNENDVNRIQAQDTLWNAVNEYLKASVETTGGHFEANNRTNTSDVPNASTGVNTSNGEDHQSESYSISSENNPSATASTIQENNSRLKGDEETLYDLSRSIPTNIDRHTESQQVMLENENYNNGNIETVGNQEQTAVPNFKLGKNTSIDINERASSLKGDQETIYELGGGRSANFDIHKENEINVENLESTAEKKKITARARTPKSMKEKHKNLIKASRDFANKMKNLVSGETIDESSNIKQNTAAIENPGQKLLEKKGVALTTQLNEIQQDLSSKWVFNKNHGLNDPEVFKNKIEEFNKTTENKTYDNNKAYWDKFTSWYAESNGGSPVVKK